MKQGASKLTIAQIQERIDILNDLTYDLECCNLDPASPINDVEFNHYKSLYTKEAQDKSWIANILASVEKHCDSIPKIRKWHAQQMKPFGVYLIEFPIKPGEKCIDFYWNLHRSAKKQNYFKAAGDCFDHHDVHNLLNDIIKDEFKPFKEYDQATPGDPIIYRNQNGYHTHIATYVGNFYGKPMAIGKVGAKGVFLGPVEHVSAVYGTPHYYKLTSESALDLHLWQNVVVPGCKKLIPRKK